jgi:hypothetical protein
VPLLPAVRFATAAQDRQGLSEIAVRSTQRRSSDHRRAHGCCEGTGTGFIDAARKAEFPSIQVVVLILCTLKNGVVGHLAMSRQKPTGGPIERERRCCATQHTAAMRARNVPKSGRRIFPFSPAVRTPDPNEIPAGREHQFYGRGVNQWLDFR